VGPDRVGVNLTTAFATGAEAAVGMRERPRGRILFLSSVAGRSGHKHHGRYAGSNGAINPTSVSAGDPPMQRPWGLNEPGLLQQPRTTGDSPEPSDGLEPSTRSLPWGSRTAALSRDLQDVCGVVSWPCGFVDYRILRIFAGRFGRGSASAAFSGGAARTVWGTVASLMHVVCPASYATNFDGEGGGSMPLEALNA
jgi:hypothetical protein